MCFMIFRYLVVVTLPLFLGCAVGKSILLSKDEHECILPPVYVSQLIEFEIAKVYLPDLSQGKLDPRKDEIALKAYGEVEIGRPIVFEYLMCRAIRSRYIKEQPEEVDYLRKQLLFLTTKPTPNAFLDWETEHPYPVARPEMQISPLVIDLTPDNPIGETRLSNTGNKLINFQINSVPPGFYTPYTEGVVRPGQSFIITIIKTPSQIEPGDQSLIIRSQEREFRIGLRWAEKQQK